MTWADECKFGSEWVTTVALEFHHFMIDGENPDDPKCWAPFPSDAVNIPHDNRSGYLVWLHDGSPVHASWCNAAETFKRMGDTQAIDRASVRAWAALRFPVATA